jgi:hypothetical protein
VVRLEDADVQVQVKRREVDVKLGGRAADGVALLPVSSEASRRLAMRYFTITTTSSLRGTA